MKKYYTSLLGALLVTTVSTAQIFSQDFCSWISTEFKGNHADNDGFPYPPSGTMSVAGGVCPSGNPELRLRDFRGQQSYRYQKNLGITLNDGQTNRKWRLEFDLTPETVHQNDEAFIALTDNTVAHWLGDDLPTYMGTGPIDGEPIYERFKTSVNAILIRYYSDPGSSQLKLELRTKVGQNIDDISDPINIFGASTSSYIRLERHDEDRLLLSVFSNPNRSAASLVGTAECLMIDPNIDELISIQAAVSTHTSTNKKASLDIDNIKIYDDLVDPNATNNSNPGSVTLDLRSSVISSSCSGANVTEETFDLKIHNVPNKHIMEKLIMDYGDGTHDVLSAGDQSITTMYASTPGIMRLAGFYYYWDGDKYVMQTVYDTYNRTGPPVTVCTGLSRTPNSSVTQLCDAILIVDNDNSGTVNFKNGLLTTDPQHIISFLDFGDCTPPVILNPQHDIDHTYEQNHDYTATLTSFSYRYNGSLGVNIFEVCSDVHSPTVIINVPSPRLKSLPTSAKAIKEQSATFSLYPNPVSENLNINLKEGVNNLRIVDVTGKLVVERQVIEQNRINIDMSEFPEGVYVISVQNGDNIQTQKVVKQ